MHICQRKIATWKVLESPGTLNRQETFVYMAPLQLLKLLIFMIYQTQMNLNLGFLLLEEGKSGNMVPGVLKRKQKQLEQMLQMIILQSGLCYAPASFVKEQIFKSLHWFYCALPSLPEPVFEEELRMPRDVLGHLLRDTQPFYRWKKKEEGAGHQPIPFPHMLCAVLYKLGHKCTIRACASKFGISKSVLSARFEAIIDIFIEQVGPRFLNWPSLTRQQYISYIFWLRRGIPGVVGCTDGSHIPFNLLDEETAVDYYCRKGFYSLILQATCDHVPLFTDVYVGWPGSVNDGRVWRNSPLKRKFDAFYDNQDQHPDFCLRNHHLLGDAAYKLDPYMMPPFKNTIVFRHTHRRYNKRQSGTRMAIERAFGQAKGKWKTLTGLNYGSIHLNCKVIMACCILHNYVKLRGVPLNDNDLPIVPNIVHQVLGNEPLEPAEKRQRIMNSLFEVVRV